jgi:pectate lyase
MQTGRLAVAIVGLTWSCQTGSAFALPSFPSAVGFGAVASGGRGGRVIHVTSLAASGAGSLAAACAASGPRYVVFDVSGVIEGDVEIAHGDITIAGQTAPGAGITIHGHLYTPYQGELENIIVRHVRVRPPPPNTAWRPEGHDAIQFSDAHKVMFDHVDVSHGVDENVDHWNGASDITWHASLLSFPNPSGGHPDGMHPYCLINADGDSAGARGGRISIARSLFAHCRTRTPALSVGPGEVVNNVVYDAREAFVHHNPAYGDFVIAGNKYVDGPSQNLLPFWFSPENAGPANVRYFLGENLIDHPNVYSALVTNPWTDTAFDAAYNFYSDAVTASAYQPLSALPAWGQGHVGIQRLPPQRAAELVLNCAGAWPRDHVAKRAVEETRMKSGSLRLLELGNLLEGLSATSAPADTDADGMPDAWENMHGFDAAKDDHLSAAKDGYPALEVYLEERANSLTPCGQASMMMGDAGVPDAGASADASVGDAAAPVEDAATALDATPADSAGAALEDSGDDEPDDAGEGTLDARSADDSPRSEGGCACRAGQRGTTTGLDLGLGLLALGLWLARRRSARQPPRDAPSSAS